MSQTGLIDWKTHAWQDPNMVAWYAQRMEQNLDTNQLKNRLELELIARHLRGHSVLDVGIGTGRASLPLLKSGYAVSGIDSSQAMLDETRRQAGDLPIELKVGDIGAVPYGDGRFDNVISLNVLVHFPNWREVLVEWKRVLKPGGRIIFDIHSFDHLLAALGEGEQLQRLTRPGETSAEFAEYKSTAGVAQIVAFANSVGLKVVAVAPYGAFLGGGNPNYWLTKLESSFRWKRLLSWITLDQRLMEFACFLEQTFVEHLGSAICGRLMVVLENQPDPAGNAELLARHTELNQREGDRLHLESYFERLPSSAEQRAALWERHFSHPRNLVLLYEIFRSLGGDTHIDMALAIPQPWSYRFDTWALQDAYDDAGWHLARNWADVMAEPAQCHGVSLPATLEYPLMKRLLSTCYGLFDEGQA
ncbi:class I SAM-dependent methyltransferase [Parachitinimonas caeni]|uniref:Class I SAM-dependent methyltransferase n=1 Tax=Parachitinimonas caeni TaxID=3031301 RepID=A0ABT7E253_9NEIS|nr:class I SAM-dependent methyltransferase [Parachitinimonas caeni]MDK2126393.1 class I SAM-dependent methyltransferase [Parachitinimonas caeni]